MIRRQGPSAVADIKMPSPDDGLLPDEASGPQRVFEGDLVVPLMSPWLALADLLRLAQTNRACMREISIGVREIGLTEFEDPATGRITDAVIASISRRFPSLRVLYLHASIVELASRCRDLWWLSLSSTSITDVSLQAIARSCRKLRHLNLQCRNMTDAGLIPLRA